MDIWWTRYHTTHISMEPLFLNPRVLVRCSLTELWAQLWSQQPDVYTSSYLIVNIVHCQKPWNIHSADSRTCCVKPLIHTALYTLCYHLLLLGGEERNSTIKQSVRWPPTKLFSSLWTCTWTRSVAAQRPVFGSFVRSTLLTREELNSSSGGLVFSVLACAVCLNHKRR